MKEYKYLEEFNIIGRGKVVTLNLKENGMEPLNKELKGLFMNKDITYLGRCYTIVGIEAFMTGQDCIAGTIGLMLKEIIFDEQDRKEKKEA